MPKVVPGQYCGHVSLTQFERQMDHLHEQGYHALTQDDIQAWLADGTAPPQKSVAINFDDNRHNVLENALPVLQARGFVATMFVITDLAGGKVLWENDYPALSWEHLARLVEAGWCIGSHTKTHVSLGGDKRPTRDAAHAIDEIAGSQEVIRRVLGVSCDHFAYPSGSIDEASDALVRQYYQTARLWQVHQNLPPAPAYEWTTDRTDPFRLYGINVNAMMSMEHFRKVVDPARHLKEALVNDE